MITSQQYFLNEVKKMTTIKVTISKESKERAERILKSMGVTMSQAIKIFIAQINHTKSLPLYFGNNKDLDDLEDGWFNEETKKAIEDVKKNRNLSTYKNVEELRKELNL